jgi:cysteine-rich repeat protein
MFTQITGAKGLVVSFVAFLAFGAASGAWADVCGNGVIETSEQCDDGNTLANDGCSATCSVEEQCYDPGNVFSFFVWSDSYGAAGDGGVMEVFGDTMNSAKYPGRVLPRFWISTGDIPFMAEGFSRLDEINGDLSGASYPFTCSASSLNFPYFVAIGNHDVDGFGVLTPAQQYGYWKNTVGPKLGTTLVGIRNFRLGPSAADGHDARTTYSFDYKNAHFVVVNQYHDDPNYPTDNPVGCIRPALMSWIEADLAATSQPVKFVFGHEPAWSYCSSEPGYGGGSCPAGYVDNRTPAFRPRPHSSTGAWLEPYGRHWGDSLEDNGCPAGSRDAFWEMLARHQVVAHVVGHTHTYGSRLVEGDGTPRNDVAAYGKTGQSFSTADGVWEMDSGETHNSAGTVYLLITVSGNQVSFEAYDRLGTSEPFEQMDSWRVSVGPSTLDTTAPDVALRAPAGGATVSGTVSVGANASDDVAVAGVQFRLDGADLGSEDTAAPYAASWNTTASANGSHALTAVARDAAGNTRTSAPVTVTVNNAPSDTIPPVVSISAPSPGATVSSTITLSASASDNVAVAGVQFELDGVALGAEDTLAPYAANWDTLSAANGSHSLTAVARDGAGNLGASAALMVTVSNPASGQTLYVDRLISPSSCTTYVPSTRSCTGGTAKAFKTLAGVTAAGVTAPGDRVYVRAGSYTGQQLAPRVSGSAAAPITYGSYPGEAAVIAGVPSDLPAIHLQNLQYLLIEGFTVSDTWGWGRVENSQHNVIQNNTFLRATDSGTRSGLKFVGSDFNAVLNNRFEDGNDNMMLEDSNRNLVEGNVYLKARHTLLNISCGSFNVVRNNRFNNPTQKGMEVFDCEGFVEGQPRKLDATKRNLVENNVFELTGADDGGGPYNGIQYAAQNGILRRNVFYGNQGIALGMTQYADEALNNKFNRVSHNVFYDNLGGGTQSDNTSAGATQYTDNQFKNNVYYRNRPGPVGWNGGLPGGSQLTHRFAGGFRFEKNDIFDQAAGDATIFMVDATRSLSFVQTNHPTLYANNLALTPGFVNASAHDFRLGAGSALIDAGAFLSTARSAGSGTALPVQDAAYFFDGYDIPGQAGDLIQLQGQTQTARVVDIDYTANVLSLDRSLSWSAGQGVSLAYSGSAPDIGAFELVAGPPDTTPPAVSLTAPGAGSTVSGSISVSASATDNVGVAGVQFKLDGANLGSEDVSAPYSVSWNTASAANGSHTLTAVARDAAGNIAVSAPVNVTVNNAPAPGTGLRAAYAFGEGSGATTADASGNGNTGTLSGTTWTGAGKYGAALVFGGASAFVSASDAPSLDLAGSGTMEVWARLNALNRWQGLIAKGGANSDPAQNYALEVDATNTLLCVLGNGASALTVASAAPLASGRFYHVACTWDGTSVRLYLDGALVRTGAQTLTPAGNTAPLFIGRFGGVDQWEGVVDEIRIYDRALGAAEITQDMITPIGG